MIVQKMSFLARTLATMQPKSADLFTYLQGLKNDEYPTHFADEVQSETNFGFKDFCASKIFKLAKGTQNAELF